MLDPRYIAGLFDADGYVTMAYRKDSKYLKIDTGISMLKNSVLEDLKEQFPNSNLYDDGKMYKWRISNGKAMDFVEFIYPYVVIKADALDFYHKWFDLPKARPRNMTDEIHQARLELHEEYKKFRRMG